MNSQINLSSSLTLNNNGSDAYIGDTINATYTVKNSANFAITTGLGICARLNGVNVDLGYNSNLTIPANSTINISYSYTANASGSYNIFICSQLPNGLWAGSYYPYDITNNLTRSYNFTIYPNPLVTSSVNISPQTSTTPTVGQTVSATFTITNSSSSSVNIGQMILAVRDSNGTNYDFPLSSSITIAGNSTYTYSQSAIFTKPGQYTYFISNLQNGSWNTNYPISGSGITRSGSFTIY